MSEPSPRHRLQVTMTPSTLEKVDKIKAAMEATSYSEVVRRVLIFLEVALDKNIVQPEHLELNNTPAHDADTVSVRIQVQLALQSVDRLENLKGRTKSELLVGVVRAAFWVYWDHMVTSNDGTRIHSGDELIPASWNRAAA